MNPQAEAPRILVVEDEPADEVLVRRALRRAMPRARVEVVRGVQSACSVLARNGADLALVDWRLPDGTGDAVVHYAADMAERVPSSS
jgi:DNA-binding response OmpR family regulator